MPRLLVGSMLVGAVAIFLGFYLLYVLQGSPGANYPAWSWDLSSGRVVAGGGNSSGQDWRLTLDDRGSGVLVIPLPALQAAHYPFLHVQFSCRPAPNALGFFWKTRRAGEQMEQYWISDSLEKSLWLPMGGIEGWAGDLLELAISVEGAPHDELVIGAIELRPDSVLDRFRVLFSDWNSLVPWDQSSINRFDATRSSDADTYPVVLVAIFLVASLAAYGIGLALRADLHLDWRVVSCIFLCCWIALDLSWQRKLWQQLLLTHAQFAGRDSQARLAAGPDAVLVRFISDIQQRIDRSDARVFVVSSSDYAGMRGSYYLYPRNVYWQRKASELPDRRYLHQGDHILLLQPADVRYDALQHSLEAPGMAPLPVQVLAESAVGSLYKVM